MIGSHVSLLLSQSTPWGRTMDILLAVGGLALLVVLGAGLILFLRSRMGADDGSGDDRTPFSLSDLRRLHRDGHLTDAEYESARARIVALFQPEASRSAGTPAADKARQADEPSAAPPSDTGQPPADPPNPPPAPGARKNSGDANHKPPT